MLFKEVYQVVENPNETDAGIELVSGEWKGLVFQFGDVQFEDGKPQMNFKRTIRRMPESVEGTDEAIEDLLNNGELNKLMGDILVELIQEQIQREEKENGKKIS
jgi:hypothetical protein|tara:strand:- start:182 stop:493 length:312 start_codon:yes stop_codon:yes gene_type:complete